MVSAIMLAVVLGCAAGPRTRIETRPTPGTDFSAYTSFAFVPIELLHKEGSQMMDPVTRRNIEATIARELQAKGLTPAAPQTPSLLIGYFVDVYQGVNEMGAYDQATGGTRVDRQGKVTIEIIEPTSEQVLWRGDGWARDPSFAVAEQVITEIVRRYPR